MQEEFLSEDGSVSGFKGMRPFSETWIRYIIEYQIPDLPEDEKNELVNMLRPVLDVAAKGYILRREIPMHLDAYDIIWDKFFCYMKRGKYDPRLLVLRESLRLGFEIQLTRAVEAAQMRMIFEPKQTMFQRFFDATNRKAGLFKRNKNRNMEEQQ